MLKWTGPALLCVACAGAKSHTTAKGQDNPPLPHTTGSSVRTGGIVPVSSTERSGYKKIQVGPLGVCGLTDDGTLQCSPPCADASTTVDRDVVDFGMRDALLCNTTRLGQLRCRDNLAAHARVATIGEFRRIRVGKLGTCVRAASGQIQCFRTKDGQLRRWGTDTSWKPWTWEYHEPGFSDVTAFDVGWGNAFFVRTSGDVWFVGLNPIAMAAAGAPSRFAQHPILVPGVTQIVEVAAALSFACAIDRLGELHCWGLGRAFGAASGPTLVLPTHVLAGGSPKKQIAAGEDHICVLDAVGAVTCLGSFAVPDGRIVFDAQRRVVQDARITQIAAGSGATCVLFGSGGYKCWGRRWDACLAGFATPQE